MTANLMTTDTDTVLHVAHRDVNRTPLTLGEVVRIRRTQLGWTQHDVAIRTGLLPWDAKQIERGLVAPTRAVRLALESALEMPMGSLDGLGIGGTTDVPPIGLTSRTGVEQVAAATRKPRTAGRLRPFVHVVFACGEVNLADAVNECLTTISAAGDDGTPRVDLSAPYLEGITYLASGADWLTAIIQYQSSTDLFPTDPDEDGSIYVERSQRSRT